MDNLPPLLPLRPYRHTPAPVPSTSVPAVSISGSAISGSVLSPPVAPSVPAPPWAAYTSVFAVDLDPDLSDPAPYPYPQEYPENPIPVSFNLFQGEIFLLNIL